MAASGGYAEVNGLHMYYEEHGEGPPLLLLHGGTCSIERPPMGIPFFSDEFQVIAPEQMGHGRTADATDRAFHYHDMAEDTVELLRQLKIESASVIGLSDGGMVGLDMAIHHPDRVTKLVLTGANYRTDGYSADAWEWLLAVKPGDWPHELREDYERLSPDGPSHWPAFLERLQSMWAVEPNYTDEQMRSVKAPTLVIAGDQDIITPEHSVALFRAIPDAQLCVLPNAGHGALPIEAILTFLQEPDPREH